MKHLIISETTNWNRIKFRVSSFADGFTQQNPVFFEGRNMCPGVSTLGFVVTARCFFFKKSLLLYDKSTNREAASGVWAKEMSYWRRWQTVVRATVPWGRAVHSWSVRCCRASCWWSAAVPCDGRRPSPPGRRSSAYCCDRSRWTSCCGRPGTTARCGR